MSKIRLNFEFLTLLSEKYGFELLDDYSSINVNRNTKIIGTCATPKCSGTFFKQLQYLYNHNSFYCNDCVNKNKIKKAEETNIKKYGVKNPFQSEVFKKKIEETNMKRYGVKNPLQNEEIKKKKENTNINKYGTKTPSKLTEVKKKQEETNMRKYGKKSPTQNIEIQNKIAKTNMKRYGTKAPAQNIKIQNKIVKTNMKRYGVKSTQQNKEIREKSIKTNMKRYGTRIPTQNASIAQKSSQSAYKLKSYILPSGNIIKLQGYESVGIDKLLKEYNIAENDIITNKTEVPEIWYKDENGGDHRHFVDFFIKSLNKCIEIKSTWTKEKKKDNIFLKQQAAKDLGYEYEIWVLNAKGKILELIS